MYRRTGIVLFLLLGAWALILIPKQVTYERGKSIDYSEGKVETVDVTCGEMVPILFDGEYAEGIPPTANHMRNRCTMAARSRLVAVSVIGLLAVASLIIGLIRGKAPRVPPIDAVLEPLPPPVAANDERV
jgi:hypothetical protein